MKLELAQNFLSKPLFADIIIPRPPVLFSLIIVSALLIIAYKNRRRLF